MSIRAHVRSSGRGQDVLHVVLERGERRNAVDAAMVDALHAAVERAGADHQVRAVVLASADPRIFCAGADVTVDEEERRYVSDRLYELYERFVRLPVPVIAAVSGPAVGGGAQLVLSSDITLGGPGARIRFVGAGHGLAIGTWALPSLVGRGRALDLSLSMRWVERDEATSIGLLTRTAEEPEVAASELAAELARYDAGALARVKRLVGEPDLVRRLRAERAANAAWSGAVETPGGGSGGGG
jgi:enoyl-CoA hydratase